MRLNSPTVSKAFLYCYVKQTLHLPIHCICVLHMSCRINSDCFPVQLNKLVLLMEKVYFSERWEMNFDAFRRINPYVGPV